MSEKQFYLLQVNDALFPIGGYSHKMLKMRKVIACVKVES